MDFGYCRLLDSILYVRESYVMVTVSHQVNVGCSSQYSSNLVTVVRQEDGELYT